MKSKVWIPDQEAAAVIIECLERDGYSLSPAWVKHIQAGPARRRERGRDFDADTWAQVAQAIVKTKVTGLNRSSVMGNERVLQAYIEQIKTRPQRRQPTRATAIAKELGVTTKYVDRVDEALSAYFSGTLKPEKAQAIAAGIGRFLSSTAARPRSGTSQMRIAKAQAERLQNQQTGLHKRRN